MKLWSKKKTQQPIRTYKKICIDCDGAGYVVESHHKIPHDFPPDRKTIRLTELHEWKQPVYCHTCKGSGLI